MKLLSAVDGLRTHRGASRIAARNPGWSIGCSARTASPRLNSADALAATLLAFRCSIAAHLPVITFPRAHVSIIPHKACEAIFAQ